MRGARRARAKPKPAAIEDQRDAATAPGAPVAEPLPTDALQAETVPSDALQEAMAAMRPDALPVGADALRELLARLQAERQAAAAKVAELEAVEADRILDESDEVLDAIAQDINRARRRGMRLELLAERVGALLRQAQDREAEDGRRARYEAAAAAAREAESWIATDYAAHAAAIGAGLARLAEVGAAIDAANEDRPAGVPRLELEASRALPAIAEAVRDVSETYYVDESGTVVEPTHEAPLWEDARGELWIGAGRAARRVEARERKRAERTLGRPAVAPRPLAVAVHLPGVMYGETDFWPRRSKLWTT